MMAVNSQWLVRHKTGLIIFIALALLLLTGLLLANRIAAPLIGSALKKEVEKSSDSLYRIDFSRLTINIFTGRVEIDDVKLTADTSRAGSANQMISGSANQLVFTGVGTFSYLFHKKLKIDQIIILDPSLNYTLINSKKPSQARKTTLYQKISPTLKAIRVGSISINHAKLSLADFTGPKASFEHLSELSMRANDLLIDSTTQRDTSRTLFCRDIIFSLQHFKGLTNDGSYHYSVSSASFSTKSAKLVARGMKLKPLPVNTFFKHSTADRFDVALDSLVLDHFNFRSFLTDHFLEVKKLSAFKGHIDVFSNPNGKLQKNDRVITFPHYMLRKLQTHFTVDTLDLSGFGISYLELNKDAGKTGVLEFKNTKAKFLNISNEPTNLATHPLCAAELSTSFMGKSKFDLSFSFNLTDKEYAYHYKGHLAAIALVDINPVIMPLALVKINTGELTSLDFIINGDQRKSTGTLNLLYRDLGIDILNRDYDQKFLKTLLVNTLVVSHNNPDQPGGQPRFAKIVYLRPKNYPFFKTLWETIFSGIKPCAGIGYAVKNDSDKTLSKKEIKAKAKALKNALKAKKKAEKQFQKKVKNSQKKTKG